MVTSEREMVQRFLDAAVEKEARFTSLQPTYEDTVPEEDLGWDDEQGS